MAPLRVRPYSRQTWAEIDLSQIERNVRLIGEFVGPGVELMPIVKAGGYGHGAVPSADAAMRGGAKVLGVASLDEAKELYENAIDCDIAVLGFIEENFQDDAIRFNFIGNLYREEQIPILERQARKLGKKARVHIKIDTGMIRLGVPEEKAGAFIRRVLESQEIQLEGIFTHCPLSDDPENSFTVEQFERFMRIVSSLPDLPEKIKLHAANSAAILDFPQTHLDLVRPGILCYGHYPGDGVKREVEVSPALELKCQIIDLKTIQPGTGIGYGHLFSPKKEMLVAVIPIGYADGYNRLHSFGGEVLIRGRRCPIVGAVSMDFTMIGVPDDLEVEMQDVVTLIGSDENEEITVSELARKLSTIPYEIFCLLGDRVYREYLNEPGQD